MRRRLATLLAAPALAVPLVLSACGSGDGASTTGATATATGSSAPNTATASASASTASSSTAAPSGAVALPTVEGAPGAKPTVKAPASPPGGELAVEVLSEGTGAEVGKGDLLVSHYLGQTYKDNRVFDNSYDRGAPVGFPIGVGQVIPGWDEALVGRKAGSRVLLVVPPDKGYGSSGQPQAGIKPDDTLVFVVDIVDRFASDAAAQGTVKTAGKPGLPTVNSQPGQKPTVTFAKGTKVPAKPTSAVLIEGNGAPLVAGKQLATQVVQAEYGSGQTLYESWGKSPVALSAEQLPGLADALKGQKLGTRVVLSLPGKQMAQPGQPAPPDSAVVVDVVGQF